MRRSGAPATRGHAGGSAAGRLMIGVGIMVGTIVIAMYLPMFKLLTLIE